MSEPRQCQGWGVKEANAPWELLDVTLPPVEDDMVEVKMVASGICASDLDACSGHYGPAYPFPVRPGHEGVGRVSMVGGKVGHLKEGDLVGLGIYRDNCGACNACSTGKDNRCAKKGLMFMGGGSGTFGEYVRIKARWAFPIPEGIHPTHAGPLMCAGGTVFAPFRTEQIIPGDKVGVVGIGGLGHLAIQFGKAWGCEVFAFSSSGSKEQFAKELGAHQYVNTSSEEAGYNSVAGQLDHILVTAGGPGVDWTQLLGCLAPDGQIIMMGNPGFAPVEIPLVKCLMTPCGIKGSAGCSSGNYLRMLQFAALHNIRPMVEVFSPEQVNQAVDKVRAGQVRFRAVVQFLEE